MRSNHLVGVVGLCFTHDACHMVEKYLKQLQTSKNYALVDYSGDVLESSALLIQHPLQQNQMISG